MICLYVDLYSLMRKCFVETNHAMQDINAVLFRQWRRTSKEHYFLYSMLYQKMGDLIGIIHDCEKAKRQGCLENCPVHGNEKHVKLLLNEIAEIHLNISEKIGIADQLFADGDDVFANPMVQNIFETGVIDEYEESDDCLRLERLLDEIENDLIDDNGLD